MERDACESDTWLLLEGGCPICDAEVDIISIGGTASELREWKVSETVDRTLWGDESARAMNAVLALEFKCANGHRHYIEKNPWGDWN
jgi:hypothetical protein